MTVAKKKGAPRSKGARFKELRLKIDAFTPETMPMARLAEYMAHVAEILGEQKSVHFVQLEAGSTVLVHRVDHEAVPKVIDRAKGVGRGTGPRDALTAYRTINKMLREDNGAAVLVEEKRGAKVLEFPGIQEAEEALSSIRQHGTLDGELVRVGGRGERVPVILQVDGEEQPGAWASRPVAKSLGGHLFETVRLHGLGRWGRDDAGTWRLSEFHITSFSSLHASTVAAAVKRVREIKDAWEPTDLAEFDRIRHGAG